MAHSWGWAELQPGTGHSTQIFRSSSRNPPVWVAVTVFQVLPVPHAAYLEVDCTVQPEGRLE